jgi:hypothetical protein
MEKDIVKEEQSAAREAGVTPLFGKVAAGHVVLPFDEEQFKGFIKSLLGSPQSITKYFRAVFEITFDDVAQLHQIILQRIAQQNGGILANFRAKVQYSDNSAVEFNRIEELLTYNEIRPIVSEVVHLTWDYMVTFVDKQHPEKQRIQISFATGNPEPIFDDEISTRVVFSRKNIGYIHMRIEHTARTWGADMESLLTQYIKGIMKRIPRWKTFVRENNGYIALCAGFTLFMSSMWGSIRATRNLGERKLQELAKLIENNNSGSLEALQNKINYISNFLVAGEWQQFDSIKSVAIVVAIMISVWITFWIYEAADNEEPSFILFTKTAGIEKEEELKKLNRRWLSFFGGVALSVITGIASNYIFQYLSSK